MNGLNKIAMPRWMKLVQSYRKTGNTAAADRILERMAQQSGKSAAAAKESSRAAGQAGRTLINPKATQNNLIGKKLVDSSTNAINKSVAHGASTEKATRDLAIGNLRTGVSSPGPKPMQKITNPAADAAHRETKSAIAQQNLKQRVIDKQQGTNLFNNTKMTAGTGKSGLSDLPNNSRSAGFFGGIKEKFNSMSTTGKIGIGLGAAALGGGTAYGMLGGGNKQQADRQLPPLQRPMVAA